MSSRNQGWIKFLTHNLIYLLFCMHYQLYIQMKIFLEGIFLHIYKLLINMIQQLIVVYLFVFDFFVNIYL